MAEDQGNQGCLIEITPEMIEAAFLVWEESGATDRVSSGDRVLLHSILAAALEARGPVRRIHEYDATEA